MADGREIRAQAVVFDRGALLCARHEKRGASYWVLPGGHVEPGESLWDALVRELAEETGLTARSGRLWSVSEFAGEGRGVLDCAFRVERWEGEAALGADPESGPGPPRLVEVGWIDRLDFDGLGLRPGVIARRLAEWWDGPEAPGYLGVERA